MLFAINLQSIVIRRVPRRYKSSKSKVYKIILMFPLYFYGIVIGIMYVLLDVNYFLRLGFLYAWVIFFRNKKKILDTTTIYGICTTRDIDIVLTHMNNARYLRELDFGRFYYYNKTGLHRHMFKRSSAAFQTASLVRHRRSILIFMPYKITTKLIYWDDRNFYMEQQFIGLKDDFVYTTVITRQTLVNSKISVQDILSTCESDIQKPKPTKELQFWLEAIKESSQNLRKQN
ncbi:hypothetical protein DMN91_012056 [Ooceraea biroi]|uniref:Protein THEM6 n=2 Tax=Ooceraea biroi TaxID=2015173 RepID=A0A3L8D7R4_OOCBI|nr:protein THEM6 isoform X1 [Ooceraea biroi]XP_026829993.1 protein THEM6 isoform X1 [Ooceraea biroi]RLU16296.1 hypothetical protein DMN91_012056 [Ooceraea biroi]